MKKLLTIVLVLALMLTAFAGCGDDGKEQKGLTFSNWSGSEAASKDIVQEMIDTFNSGAGENNQVTQINWSWGDTESQLALRANGSEPFDVAQIDIRMLPALAEAGILADLHEVFGKSYFDQFPEGSVAVGNHKGVQYGVPWTVAPMAMISNPKILKEAGVDFDVVTIADFEKACEMVKKNHPNNKDADKGNDIIPYAAMNKDSGTTAPDFMVWLWTFGANVFDASGNLAINSDKAVEALEWFNEMNKKGYMQNAMDRGNARTLYKEGRVAFYDDALLSKGAIYNEAFGAIEDQAKPIPHPVLKEGDKAVGSGWGHLLVVIDRSPNKEGAKDFINHLLSDEVSMKYFEENGMLPSKTQALANPKITNDYWSKSWTPILEGGRLAETAGPKYGAYNQVILDQIQAMLSGTKTPKEAADAMQSGLKNA